MAVELAARIESALRTARAAGRLRTLESRHGAQGVDVTLDGRTLTNFTSNDYLGLAAHPRILDRVRSELGLHGFGSGSAALLSGRSSLHAEFERALADYTGMESALLFSSGYLANLGALTALTAPQDLILHDRLNHASLIDAVRASGARHLRYPHRDYMCANTLLTTHSQRVKWVLTESEFSMDGDIAPLADLGAVCAAHDAMLYVDDAHGFGVLAHGRGAAPSLDPARKHAQILMITLGKTLGAVGGVVLGTASMIEFLIQRARTFIYDTALPPVCAAAALEALTLMRDEPTLSSRLLGRVNYFRVRAAAAGIPLTASTTPIQPLMIGDDARALFIANALVDAGLYVRAIRPPTVPSGTARLRVTLTVAHSNDQIDLLVAALARHLAT